MSEHNPIDEQSKQKALDSSRQEAGEYLTKVVATHAAIVC